MNYIKKILKAFIFPAVFIVGEFFINYVFVAIFNSRNLIKYRELFPDLNDIEIITQVGCGVAMGNAIDEVKNAANEVTISNDENHEKRQTTNR